MSDELPRAAENCPFYPGCYIHGDCDFEDWRNGNCGLPRDEQAKLRKAWLAGIALRHARFKLGEDLARQASRGAFDHMLDATAIRLLADGEKGGG